MVTAKEVVLIESIQRKMDYWEVNAYRAAEKQQEDVNTYTAQMYRAGMELESVSGSPEQGLVLVFKSVD